MNLESALQYLMQEKAIVVNGKTFQPVKVDKIKLLTGEVEYWVKGEDYIWLAIDSGSDEVRLFQDIDEVLEVAEDTVFYLGQDYEFSLEGGGKVLDEEGEQLDTVAFREYESSRGEILRVIKFEVSEDAAVVAIGMTITEDDLQEF